MKQLLPFCALAVVLMFGCKERELNIPELTVGARHVLVEELTGVKCTNCPDAARLLANLQKTYGEENLIIVAIHEAPDFSVPYTGANGNLYDFRSVKGKELFDAIGVYEGAPSAAISRFLPNNSTSFFLLPYPTWPGFINAEFSKDYGLGLFVKNEYDPTTRQLDVLVNIAPEETLTGDHRLTVVITQDSIIDVQNDNNVIINNYVHRHVFRDLLTLPTGDDIPEALTAGALVSKTFRVNLPVAWDAKHCNVVAYVHHTGTPDKVVLQATEAHVIE